MRSVSLYAAQMSSPKILILGGARSGKSEAAEQLLADQPKVTYLATGARSDDQAWQERIETHQKRRPATWETFETTDVSCALGGVSGPVMWDCVGTWLSAAMDDVGAWDDQPTWRTELEDRVDLMLESWTSYPAPLIAVTSEVGLGVVPPTTAGSTFRDILGLVNQKLAQRCDHVFFMIAGRRVPLMEMPTSLSDLELPTDSAPSGAQ